MSFLSKRIVSLLAGRSTASELVHVKSISVLAQRHSVSAHTASTSITEEDGADQTASTSAPDVFLSHLQHKTENELLDLLNYKGKEEADGDEDADRKV